MSQQPGIPYPHGPYQGQQQPFPVPIPPYLLKPNTPQYFRAAGASLLWSTLLTIPAYTLAIYPGIWAILSIALLILPLASVAMGFQKTKSFPEVTAVPIGATLLPLLVIAGTGLQDAVNLAGGEITIVTSLAGYLIGALLLASIIMLSIVAKHFPAAVSKAERLGSNITVSSFIGSTVSSLALPLIVLMGMFVFVGGWWTYALTVVPFVLGIVGTIIFLFVTKDKRKDIPGKLLEVRRIIPYSIIFACLSFTIAASVVFGMMVVAFPSL